MSLELPQVLVDLFGFVGLPWPAVDEDEMRGWAADLRAFATEITEISQLSHDAVEGLKDSNESSFVRTMAANWDHHHAQIMEMRGPMDDFADALDVAAKAVVVQKKAVITAAVALAAAVGFTQGEALFTFGIAEAEVPAEVAIARIPIRFALQELENEILNVLINHAAGLVSDAAGRKISALLQGGVGVYFEAQSVTADFEAMKRVASTVKTHAHRTEDVSTRAHRHADNRRLETESHGGGWHVGAILEAALKSVAEDLLAKLPGALHAVLLATEKDLEKAAARLKAADDHLAGEAPHTPHGDDGLPLTAAAGAAGAAGGLPPGDPPRGPGGGDGDGDPEPDPEPDPGDGDPVAIMNRQIARANDEDDPAWFNKYYDKTGRRRNKDATDATESAHGRVGIPKLRANSDPPPRWIAADSVPPPIPPKYRAMPPRSGTPSTISGKAKSDIDAARTARNQARADHDQAKKDLAAAQSAAPADAAALAAAEHAVARSHAARTDAGEHYGETVARNHAVPDHFPEYHDDVTPPKRGNGNGQFDQVYKTDDGRYLIVEAKGPSAELGSRRGPGNRDYKQGTPEYFDSIINEMRDKGTPDEQALAAALKAAKKAGKVDYVVVRPRETGGKYDGYDIKQFDLS